MTTWQAQNAPPQEAVANHAQSTIRLTRADATQIDLIAPRLEGDTIVGAHDGRLERVPVSEVVRLEVAHHQDGNVALALLGIAAIVGIGLAVSNFLNYQGW